MSEDAGYTGSLGERARESFRKRDPFGRPGDGKPGMPLWYGYIASEIMAMIHPPYTWGNGGNGNNNKNHLT